MRVHGVSHIPGQRLCVNTRESGKDQETCDIAILNIKPGIPTCGSSTRRSTPIRVNPERNATDDRKDGQLGARVEVSKPSYILFSIVIDRYEKPHRIEWVPEEFSEGIARGGWWE